MERSKQAFSMVISGGRLIAVKYEGGDDALDEILQAQRNATALHQRLTRHQITGEPLSAEDRALLDEWAEE